MGSVLPLMMMAPPLSQPSPAPPVLSKEQTPHTSFMKSAISAGTPDTWKIALLGDGGVGKTALAVQVRLLLGQVCAKLRIASSRCKLSLRYVRTSNFHGWC